jgi:hypothetical protein
MTDLPASVYPFVNVWALNADGRRSTVAGPDCDLVTVRAKDPLLDRGDDRREASALKGRVAGTSGKQGVTCE